MKLEESTHDTACQAPAHRACNCRPLHRLRDEASTSATVLGTTSKGDTVVVLEDAGNGWYKVDYKSVEGYMSGEYLNVSAKADVTIGYGLVQSQGSPLNVRSGPGTSALAPVAIRMASKPRI